MEARAHKSGSKEIENSQGGTISHTSSSSSSRGLDLRAEPASRNGKRPWSECNRDTRTGGSTDMPEMKHAQYGFDLTKFYNKKVALNSFLRSSVSFSMISVCVFPCPPKSNDVRDHFDFIAREIFP